VIFYSAKEGQSLFSVCVDHFARCTAETFREMRKLNPQLGVSNYLAAGQMIRLPSGNAFNAGIDPTDPNVPTRRTTP
jgi:hypothetical protein